MLFRRHVRFAATVSALALVVGGGIRFDGAEARSAAPVAASDLQTWLDKSGNANNATPTNAGQLPTYAAGAYNGQGTITFNTANTSSAVNNTTQAFSLGTNIITPQETMFFALRMFDNGDNRGVWV